MITKGIWEVRSQIEYEDAGWIFNSTGPLLLTVGGNTLLRWFNTPYSQYSLYRTPYVAAMTLSWTTEISWFEHDYFIVSRWCHVKFDFVIPSHWRWTITYVPPYQRPRVALSKLPRETKCAELMQMDVIRCLLVARVNLDMVLCRRSRNKRENCTQIHGRNWESSSRCMFRTLHSWWYHGC